MNLLSLFARKRNGPITRQQIILSYAADWLVTIALAAIFFSLDKVPGFKRDFSVTDLSIRHPFAVHERVPNWALVLIAFVAPLILNWVVNLLSIRSKWDAHISALGLILSLAITGVIVQFTKITVGRPRPDLLSRCNIPEGTVDPPYGLTTWEICNQPDESVLKDGFRSFPSGHAGFSFAGLGFMAFYLAGKVHLFDNRGHAPKAWLSLAPLAGAALVAISRTMDYRHHWQDVLVGGALGLFVSYFAYRQYYPPLTSRRSHVPYTPRDKDAARAGPILPTTREEDEATSVRYTDVHAESDSTDGGEELREVHSQRKDESRRGSNIAVPLNDTQ
ncbi:acid phosphatase/Vanadium-dependent haloperoxidase [Peniophora sp. CONT]|nr:acid phosphatase/Vanadium-dependent haloperoxidase [Peniophora sp. CONT]